MKRLCLVCFVVTFAVSSASAQIAQPPPRTTRPTLGGGAPPNPNLTRHEVVLDSSLLGGYDDNVGAQGFFTPANSVFRPSAYTAAGDLGVTYFVGNNVRNLNFQTRGYGNTYRNVGRGPDYGGDFAASGTTELGRRTNLSMNGSYQVAPFYSLAMFGNLPPRTTGPTSNLANALFSGRTYFSNVSAAIGHELSRRTRATVLYGYGTRHHQDRLLLDNKTHNANLSVNRELGRTLGLRGAYNYSQQAINQTGANAVVESHTLDAGFTMRRQLSRTRAMNLSGGGGAHYVDSSGLRVIQQKYWKPNLYGTLSLDVGRTWVVTVDYRQSSNTLPAPVIGPQNFLSHSATVSTGGYIGSRVELVFSAGNSNGAVVTSGQVITGQAPPAEIAKGNYAGYTGDGQLRVLITDRVSAVAIVNHYQARLDGSAAQFLQTTPDLHRNSVRVGVAWNLPLYGTTVRQPRVRGRGTRAGE